LLLLLDTHAFLWWNADDPALGPRARAAIADGDNIVFVSAATSWEIATKRRSGKLDAPGDTGIRSIAYSSRKRAAKS
jgi:PIN domain nuclease of toxin-antitoxin system